MEYLHLKKEDKEVYQILKKERERLNDDIDLIASENVVSTSVLEAAGSPFILKYAEGYPR